MYRGQRSTRSPSIMPPWLQNYLLMYANSWLHRFYHSHYPRYISVSGIPGGNFFRSSINRFWMFFVLEANGWTAPKRYTAGLKTLKIHFKTQWKEKYKTLTFKNCFFWTKVQWWIVTLRNDWIFWTSPIFDPVYFNVFIMTILSNVIQVVTLCLKNVIWKDQNSY